MMLADAEQAIPYFLAMMVTILIPTCIAFNQSRRGRYYRTLVVFAWIQIIFVVRNEISFNDIKTLKSKLAVRPNPHPCRRAGRCS
jgi:hypothetical protein